MNSDLNLNFFFFRYYAAIRPSEYYPSDWRLLSSSCLDCHGAGAFRGDARLFAEKSSAPGTRSGNTGSIRLPAKHCSLLPRVQEVCPQVKKNVVKRIQFQNLNQMIYFDYFLII